MRPIDSMVTSTSLLLLLGSCFQETPPLTWDTVRIEIAQAYPDVQQLSTQELEDWLMDDTRPPPVLLDVRSPAEYALSHLPGAQPLPPGGDTMALLAKHPKDTPLVAYCSVGHRSSRLAVELQELGYTQVFNLDGSIFGWANEGRPLENEKGSLSKVHPYNRRWGRLLDPEFH